LELDARSWTSHFTENLPGDPDDRAIPRQVRAVWSPAHPTAVAAPEIVAWSPEVASLLGIPLCARDKPETAALLGGNATAPGVTPWAQAYGGHQFGHWAGQLGDGRAMSIGELTHEGRRWELQLKGAGPTPYSRSADGRAVLRSSIREFLCSEAMHHLGVPTTRALSLVKTGDQVVRDMFYDGNAAPEPGAIVCRVAPSFLRFGSLELHATRGDIDLLRSVADYALAEFYPELGSGKDGYVAMLAEIGRRTAHMIAHWMRVGFVHGVMNTDNMSLLGLTIDYGPYGWIDPWDPDWTPNTTDAQRRRYRFGQQPAVAAWNLVRLAEAFYPLVEDVPSLEKALHAFEDAWSEASRTMIQDKLGLMSWQSGDDQLWEDLDKALRMGEVDMTLFFRALTDGTPIDDAFYGSPSLLQRQALDKWLARHAERTANEPEGRKRMQQANPIYVLRNYLAQEAIEKAEQGDFSAVHELLDVMRNPYTPQPGRERFAEKRPEWARNKAGSSMLSCSS